MRRGRSSNSYESPDTHRDRRRVPQHNVVTILHADNASISLPRILTSRSRRTTTVTSRRPRWPSLSPSVHSTSAACSCRNRGRGLPPNQYCRCCRRRCCFLIGPECKKQGAFAVCSVGDTYILTRTSRLREPDRRRVPGRQGDAGLAAICRFL